jgi:YfiH family protein
VHSQLESTGLADRVLAIQTTRVSPHKTVIKNTAYKDFNLGLHVGDCAKQVQYNRQCLQELFPSKTIIQWLEQVHSNKVIEISSTTTQTIIGDAMVTREKNIGLAIMTADCLPILLISKQGDEIAAIHGGWRPLVNNIITNTVNKMHTSVNETYAWLGPCIGKKVFEVGSEVQRAFVEQGNVFSQAFCKQENGKYLADLHEIATIQLNKLGITQIKKLSECTYSEPKKYYSYRKKIITGRMATVITLL